MAALPDDKSAEPPSGRSAEEQPRTSPNPAARDAETDPQHAALPVEEAAIEREAGKPLPNRTEPNMAQQTTWVVVFDGKLARVYRREPGSGRLHELDGEGLDARGRHRSEHGAGGGDDIDVPHAGYLEEMSEPDFIQHFAKRLAERAAQGGFSRLIVAADPHALGTFRSCAPQTVKDKIQAEVDRDYVHTPVKELQTALEKRLEERAG